ncbi:protein arginine methyltransferase 3 [Zostera marina]|uniref:Protein arginine methyltransferase 3 n=1 Tax=Zostera marina TaxID=29655 RepID=A0A0K9PTM2_ZOSMR|nr:protein arginine methyltransferase 3 [Zostera marina]
MDPKSNCDEIRNDQEELEEVTSSVDDEEEGGGFGVDWDDWDNGEDEESDLLLCLFCDSCFSSTQDLFKHCVSDHSFDFPEIRTKLGLDFYESFKLINYVRTQVSKNKCWDCSADFETRNDLLQHLHVALNLKKGGEFVWMNDLYLKPFMRDDALLQSFDDDGFDDDNEVNAPVEQEELAGTMTNIDFSDCVGKWNDTKANSSYSNCSNGEGSRKVVCLVNGVPNLNGDLMEDKIDIEKNCIEPNHVFETKQMLAMANASAKQLKDVNDSYFGAYGTYGIHREMIGDKVRMNAYKGAILNNPSLLNKATVLDVGCGTGILSLFAAQAGASRVIAVEASEKMSTMAKLIVKKNGHLIYDGQNENSRKSGVVEVVKCMVEDLENHVTILPDSVDILVSEWMGYCLLYETMLSSVLYARDHWLKPGGAILPDTATIFAAGFGKDGTSVPFWENVYGFDMSCIGREVSEDAARNPIVDVIDSNDILTDTAVVQAFDLATMKPEEMEFTTTFKLQLKSNLSAKSGSTWCYGMVLWFDTGFTRRFCKENPTVLSTSPYTQKTHWSQTLFTFHKPIALTSSNCLYDNSSDIGTEACPAVSISTRISIARAPVHRSIDISLEVTGVTSDGRRHSFPAQIFNL